MIRANTNQLDELTDEGYYTYIKNVKASTERELLILFQQMREVLIEKTSRYVVTAAGNSAGYYVVGASIVMKWEDEDGQIRFSVFKDETREHVEEWIRAFRRRGIALYKTEENIGSIADTKYSQVYGEIDKQLWDENEPVRIGGYLMLERIPEYALIVENMTFAVFLTGAFLFMRLIASRLR